MNRVVTGNSVLGNAESIASLETLDRNRADTRVQVQARQNHAAALQAPQRRFQRGVRECVEAGFVSDDLAIARPQRFRRLVSVRAADALPAVSLTPVGQTAIVVTVNGGPNVNDRHATLATAIKQRCRSRNQSPRCWLKSLGRQIVFLQVN